MIKKGDFVTLHEFEVLEIGNDKCLFIEQAGLGFWVGPYHVASVRPAKLTGGEWVLWLGDLYQVEIVIDEKAWIKADAEDQIVFVNELTFVRYAE